MYSFFRDKSRGPQAKEYRIQIDNRKTGSRIKLFMSIKLSEVRVYLGAAQIYDFCFQNLTDMTLYSEEEEQAIILEKAFVDDISILTKNYIKQQSKASQQHKGAVEPSADLSHVQVLNHQNQEESKVGGDDNLQITDEQLSSPPQYNTDAKKADIIIMKEIVQLMPSHSNKSCMEIIILLWDSLFDQKPTQQVDQDKLETLFKRFLRQCQQEEVLIDKLFEIRGKHSALLADNKLDQFALYYEELLRSLEVFSIPKLLKLIALNHASATSIKGKDIILILGSTGSGKSTLVQLLAGCEMEEVKINGLTNIQAKSFPNDQISKVRTSPIPKSETLYITPVYVLFKDIKFLTQIQGIFLCDSPGFADSRGCEIDISNAIGIIQAVKECKSVKLLIVFSKITLGDRCQGLNDILDVLIGMLPNIKQFLTSIEYVFTKYDQKQAKEIRPFLQQKFENLTEPERNNQMYVTMLQDMLRKLGNEGDEADQEEKRICVNPLKDKAADIFQKLEKQKAILKPGKHFQFAISDSSKSSIKDQMTLLVKSTKNALERGDVPLIQYNLGNMNLLNTYLDEYEYVKQPYEESIKIVNKYINEKFQKMKKHLERCFGPNNELTIEDIEEYQQDQESSRQFADIKAYLGKDTIDESTYIQELHNNVDKLLTEITNKLTIDSSIRTNLIKIYRVAQVFEQYESTANDAKNHLAQIITGLKDQTKQMIQYNKFKESILPLQTIIQAQQLFQDLVDPNIFKEAINDCETFLQSQFNQFYTEVKLVFSSNAISEKDIDYVKEKLDLFKSAIDYYERINTINMETSKELYANLIKIINNHNDILIQKHQDLIQKKDDKGNLLKNLQPVIEQMSYLQKISFHEKQHSVYYNNLSEVVALIQAKYTVIEEYISKMEQDSIITDLKDLTQNIQMFLSSQWINNFRQGVFEDIKQDIDDILIEYCKKLQKSIQGSSLDLYNIDKLKQASLNMRQLADLNNLSTIFPLIGDIYAATMKWFGIQITTTCNIITKIFTMDEIKKSSGQELDYKKAEQAHKYLKELGSLQFSQYASEYDTIRQSTYETFDMFLNDYKQMLYNQISHDYQKVRESQEADISVSQRLIQRLNELKKVVNYELIKLKFGDVDEKISYYKSKLQKDIGDYRQNLQLLGETNLEESHKMIQKIHSLIELDEFCENQGFTKLDAEFYSQLLAKNVPDNYLVAKAAIEEHSYNDVIEIILQFESTDNKIFIKYLDQLKKLINQSFEKLLAQIIQKLKKFHQNDNMTIESFEDYMKQIATDLKNHTDSNIIDNKYYSNSVLEKKQNSEQEIRKLIKEGLIELIALQQSYIKKDNLSESRKLKAKLKCIKENISDYIDKVTLDSINDLNNEVDNALDKLYDFYTTTEDQEGFYKVKEKNLNQVFNNLFSNEEKSNQASSQLKYQSELTKLETIIMDSFIRIIKEIEECKIVEKKTKLKEIEKYFHYLPQEIKGRCQHVVNEIRQDITEGEKALKEELDHAIQMNDFPQMNSYFNEYKKSITHTQVVRSIKETFNKQAKFHYTEILRYSEDALKLESCLQELNKLYELKIQYKDNFSDEIKPYFEDAKTVFYKLIRKIFEYIKNTYEIKQQRSSQSIHSSSDDDNDSFAMFDMERFEKIGNNSTTIDNFIIILSIYIQNQQLLTEVHSDISSQIEQTCKFLNRYFTECTKNFNLKLQDHDIRSVKTVLASIKEKDQILRKMRSDDNIQQPSSQAKLNQLSLTNIIEEALDYNGMKGRIMEVMRDYRKYLMETIILDKIQILNYSERQSFYQEYKVKLDFMRDCKQLDTHLSSDTKQKYVDSSEQISKAFNQLFTQANNFIANQQFSDELCQLFSVQFNILKEMIDVFRDLEDQKNNLQFDHTCSQINIVFDQLQHQAQANLDIVIFKNNIVSMKQISNNLTYFQKAINTKIDNALKFFYETEKKTNRNCLNSLSLQLQKETVGMDIITQHLIFDGFMNKIFNDKVSKTPVKEQIKLIQGPNVDEDELLGAYEKYVTCFDTLIETYLSDPKKQTINPIRNELLTMSEPPIYENQKITWDQSIIEQLPKMIAHLFALYTLMNQPDVGDSEEQSEKTLYFFRPQPAQVLSIYRLLGVGTFEEMQNHICEIGTGSGKSVTLAVTACVLALLGCEVSCVCFSKDLSQRDYNKFLHLFEELGITKYIQYGTFQELCESMINSKGDIRKLVQKTIENSPIDQLIKSDHRRPRALLIDEIDVFFVDFIGQLYTPSAVLRDQTISDLLDLIWRERQNKITVASIVASQQYLRLVQRYAGWDKLFYEIVKQMIFDLKHYQEQDYVVNENKIGYKSQDTILYNVKYGYKTVFQYYHEQGLGRIDYKSLEENKNIQIKCGNLSYSEIPKMFNRMLGVSGTLQTMSEEQKQVVQNEFNMKDCSIMPPVFGPNKVVFDKKCDLQICKTDQYFPTIKNVIQQRLQGLKTPGPKRAVIVYFESKEKLEEFYNSPYFDNYRDKSLKMTEGASADEKERFIRNVVLSGKVGLTTKAFGRGTDYVNRDKVVEEEGGIHILAVFLPEGRSEQQQMEGRTGRQGDTGSFSMVLLAESLEKFDILQAEIDKNCENLYDFLDAKRNKYSIQQYQSNKDYIDMTHAIHIESARFLDSLQRGNCDKETLIQFNKGPDPLVELTCKTLLLIDATSSMVNLISKLKSILTDTFQRLEKILMKNEIQPERVMIQLAFYRNYNSQEDKLLEYSNWEPKAEKLISYLQRIVPQGGWENEAIEIALQHANMEIEKDKENKISQIILIGDAPCNKPFEVEPKRRQKFGESYWKRTIFANKTTDEIEISKLKDANVPIHALFLKDYIELRDNFKKYACLTNGSHQHLDLDQKQAGEQLTNLLSESILAIVGKQTNKGDALMKMYMEEYNRSQYNKSYT